MNPTNMPNDILDIKPAVPIPLDWWWWAAALTSVVIGAALFWWWKRRLVGATHASPLPVPSAYDLAMRALQQLLADNPAVEVFYTRLSDIVRHYIEERFGLRAPERTTEEFLAEANLPATQMALLGAFLQECDLVKFARHQPDASDRQRAFAAAEKFVEEAR